MKAKRLIKGFIYLFPVLFVCITAFASCLFRLNENYTTLISERVGTNPATTYQYSGSFESDSGSPFKVGMQQFSDVMGYDISSDLIDPVYSLIGYFGLVENEGTLYYFVGSVIIYEIIAIMLCAVLDVIFLIPEFYNKIEDKYIKGGKKRE